MEFVLTKFQRMVKEWNKKALTNEDFHRLCRRERIHVHEMPLQHVDGFYMVLKGQAHIVINSNLRGVAWLQAAFHELGHHFLHVPKQATAAYFYKKNPSAREEREADAFAIVALIPQKLMQKLIASEEYLDDTGLSAELLKERCDLYLTHSI